ncbi:hypothetical protein BGX31_002933, partial [Mortierella sp. GBA43]
MNVRPGGADSKNTYRSKGMRFFNEDGVKVEQNFLEEDGITTKGLERVIEEQGLSMEGIKK